MLQSPMVTYMTPTPVQTRSSSPLISGYVPYSFNGVGNGLPTKSLYPRSIMSLPERSLADDSNPTKQAKHNSKQSLNSKAAGLTPPFLQSLVPALQKSDLQV